MTRKQAVQAAFMALLLATSAGASECRAVEITQYFPVAVAGGPCPRPEWGWKIKYELRPAGTHNYGGSAVLECQRIAFMRGYQPSGEEDWLNILNRLVMAEMYVPYYGPREIWDITGYFF